MSNDFEIYCSEKKDNHFQILGGENHISYLPIEIVNILRSDFEVIRKNVPRGISFEWVERRNSTPNEPNEGNCWDPKIIKKCIEAIVEIIIDNPSEFPIRYEFLLDGDVQLKLSLDFYYNELPYRIYGNWGKFGKCVAKALPQKKIGFNYGPNEEIDFSDYEYIECFECLKGQNNEPIKGKRIVIGIVRINFFQTYGSIFTHITKVCDIAIQRGLLLYVNSNIK